MSDWNSTPNTREHGTPNWYNKIGRRKVLGELVAKLAFIVCEGSLCVLFLVGGIPASQIDFRGVGKVMAGYHSLQNTVEHLPKRE